MFVMRYLVVLSFALLACVAAKDDRRNEYQWGTMKAGDDIVYRKVVSNPGKKMSKAEKYITFPSLLDSKDYIITKIEIKDLSKNGYANLHAGKIGSRSVTIQLKSVIGQGFRFFINIYGRKSL